MPAADLSANLSLSLPTPQLGLPPERGADWPPGALWGVGSWPTGSRLAVVGARAADAYGLDVARRIAQAAAAAGVCVVSGGAYGVDVAAHQGAIEAQGSTLVILGNGLDQPKPSAHQRVFAQALGRGAVLSPFEPSAPASKWSYPKRNPWIAAIAQALIVVQATARSGSLQTARAALALGRPVFVVPGPMESPLHSGCFQLLSEGARVLTGVEAWRSALPEWAPPAGAARGEPESSRSLAERAPAQDLPLWRASGGEAQTLAQLAHTAGLSLAEAAAQALRLELSGWLRSAPGGRYVRSWPAGTPAERPHT